MRRIWNVFLNVYMKQGRVRTEAMAQMVGASLGQMDTKLTPLCVDIIDDMLRIVEPCEDFCSSRFISMSGIVDISLEKLPSVNKVIIYKNQVAETITINNSTRRCIYCHQPYDIFSANFFNCPYTVDSHIFESIESIRTHLRNFKIEKSNSDAINAVWRDLSHLTDSLNNLSALTRFHDYSDLLVTVADGNDILDILVSGFEQLNGDGGRA